MSTFLQQSFSGGLNLLVDDTRLKPDEYRLGFNLRNRFDTLIPNLVSVQDPMAPVGLKQALVALSLSTLVLFVAGKAYYKVVGSTNWVQIPNFQMSTTAYRLYTEIVPASTINVNRVLTNPTIVSTNSAFTDTLQFKNTPVFATPAAMVVQDGVNQPWIIFIDPITGLPNSRVTQTYADWDQNGNREYVPIGSLMLYFNGKLYVVAPDGHTIYSSVTGRPLDFVINITISGDKGGDASTFSYSVSFDPITCIQALNTTAIFVSTVRYSYAITPDYNITFWGEPTFDAQTLFEAGTCNQFSFLDILGDFAFIDHEGLRSFNAVLQEKNEGRNSIFSLKISRVFKGLLQPNDFNCAIMFDNYALFSVQTVYGKCLVVYDVLAKVFVSIDFAVVGNGIKQMARFETGELQLYAIAEDNNIYHIYGGTTYEIASVQTASWCSQVPAQELKPQKFRVTFSDQVFDDAVLVTCYVNGKRVPASMAGTKSENLYSTSSGASYPLYYPVLFDSGDVINNLYFQYTEASQGWKHNYMIRWGGGGVLTTIQSDVKDLTPLQPLTTQGRQSTQKQNP